MTTLMVSQGVPMILGGDEFLRTQQGNNNAWCQDNAIGWVDWSLRRDERRLPAFRPDDDRAAAAPPGLAAADVLPGRSGTSRRTSSGTASSRASPTSASRAVRWPSRSTAGGSIGRDLLDRDIYVAFNAY